MKCADCGKYGHAGGDEKCAMYKEMVAHNEARAKHEELVASLPPPSQKPVAEKKSPKAKAVPTSAEGASAAAAPASYEQEEVGAMIKELPCAKCRREGMVIRRNLDKTLYYGCQNFGTFMRCQGAYSWMEGQGMLRGAGSAARHAFRG